MNRPLPDLFLLFLLVAIFAGGWFLPADLDPRVSYGIGFVVGMIAFAIADGLDR